MKLLVIKINPTMKLLKYLLVINCIFFFFVYCSNSNTTNNESLKEDSTKTQVLETKKGNWEIVDVVDEFGDKVEGKTGIIGLFEGEMSNSATEKAELKVKMQVNDSSIYTTFFEYGTQEAKLPKSETLIIKIKKGNGDIIEMEQFLYNNMMVDVDGELLKMILSEETPLKIIADISTISRYETAKYIFVIEPKGLNELRK